MKKILTITFMLAICMMAGTASAELDWKFVKFDSIIEGALSYDASGADVVSNEDSKFRTTMGSTLSTQKIGGDGVNNPVTGNFAFYGAFNYTDTGNVLAWAQSISTTPLAIELTAHTLNFDLGGGNVYSDYFALDARDMTGVDYLTATFADLGAWGCTEIAPNIWMDIAVDAANSRAAISIVMQDTSFGSSNLDLSVIAGNLDGQTQNWRASGFYVAVVPEPATLALLGLGGLLLRKRRA